MRRFALSLIGLITCALVGAPPLGTGASAVAQRPAGPSYRSPYRAEFTRPTEELIGDIERSERGDPRIESEVPPQEWYSHRVREHWGAWGPPARTYPPVPGLEDWSVERKRERVVAVALRFVGYAYQHHHIPDWNPPPDWPWKECCAGRNGRGVDCSNFTGFVYNLGFGIRLNTDVHKQSEERFGEGPGHARTPLHLVELPESYEDRLATLRTGDLLFIRNRSGRISHVVIWVGSIGRSPADEPLILDSHGEDVRDCEGTPIPCGRSPTARAAPAGSSRVGSTVRTRSKRARTSDPTRAGRSERARTALGSVLGIGAGLWRIGGFGVRPHPGNYEHGHDRQRYEEADCEVEPVFPEPRSCLVRYEREDDRQADEEGHPLADRKLP